MVVLGHAGDFGLPSFMDGGASRCGVLIFFALSGLLIGDLYLVTPPTPQQLKDYGAARIARIVPLYYPVVLAAFVIQWIDPAFIYAVPPVQRLGLLTFNESVSVFWSIGAEVQCYPVFLALCILYWRLRNDVIFTALVLGLAGIGLVTIHRWPGILVASKFHLFALGMLATLVRERLAERLPLPATSVVHALAFTILVVFLMLVIGQTLLGPTPFGRGIDPAFTNFYGGLARVILAALLALAFSFTSRPAALILANPLATLLGRCSFSIYLLHVAVYQIASQSSKLSLTTAWVRTSLLAVFTICVSVVTKYFLELPAQQNVRYAALLLLRRQALIRSDWENFA